MESQPDLSRLSTRKLRNELKRQEAKLNALLGYFPELKDGTTSLTAQYDTGKRSGRTTKFDELSKLRSRIEEFKLELFRRGKWSSSARAADQRRASLKSASSVAPIRSNRRALVTTYIEEVRVKTGKRISKKDIWTEAGYASRTEFERWERGDSKRQNKAADERFTRLLLTEKPHLK